MKHRRSSRCRLWKWRLAFFLLLTGMGLVAKIVDRFPNKEAFDPKLGKALTHLYNASFLLLRQANPNDAAEEEEAANFVAVEIVFTEKFDPEQAKELLGHAVSQVNALDSVVSCRAFRCSARVPVRALKEIASLDQVRSLHLSSTTKKD